MTNTDPTIQSLLDGSTSVAELAEGWKQQARKHYKRAKSSAAFYKKAAQGWAKDATTGQKTTAAFIAGGTALGATARGRKAWKRSKGKPKTVRLKRTAKGVAKGAFGGAIGGAITGHGVGRAIDYLKSKN